MSREWSGLCHDSGEPRRPRRPPRVRLDQLLVERGLVETRAAPRRSSWPGKVRVGEGDACPPRPQAGGPAHARNADRRARRARPFVSRGGHKLAAALDAFGIDPRAVSASTSAHPRRLHGRAPPARRDARVCPGRRARAAGRGASAGPAGRLDGADERPDADGHVAPGARDARRVSMSRSSRSGSCSGRWPRRPAWSRRRRSSPLVKPQFEAGRADVTGGVVRDPAVHRAVLERIVAVGRGGRARDARRHRLAAPRTGRQSRVPGHTSQSGAVAAPTSRRCSMTRSALPWARPEMRFGFAYNPTNEAALELRERAAGWCRMHGIEHGPPRPATRTRCVPSCRRTDVLVVLGGDGTFLRAARAVTEVDVPILGINLGKIGFLSKAEAHELEPVLARIVAGEYRLDERMALEGRILPAAARPPRNVYDRAERHRRRPRVARTRLPARRRRSAGRTSPPSSPTASSSSSPTGSTGYSFSAGGPIVDPISRNLIVTPIAGYLSAIRSVVVGPDQTVRCRVRRRARGARLGRRSRGPAARGRRRRGGAGRRAPDPVHRAKGRHAVLGPAAPQGRAAPVVMVGHDRSRAARPPARAGRHRPRADRAPAARARRRDST